MPTCIATHRCRNCPPSHTAGKPACRAAAAMPATPMPYVDHPSFHEPEAEARLFGPAVSIPLADDSWYGAFIDDSGVGRSGARMASVVLSEEQERTLFLQYNYARYRVSVLQQAMSRGGLHAEQTRLLRDWHARALRLRGQLAKFNLALVVSMARRGPRHTIAFAELVSEGNVTLLRTIDRYDVSRGFRFSTYACRAILKGFSRMTMVEIRHRQRFTVELDVSLDTPVGDDPRSDAHEAACADEVGRIVSGNLAGLTQVEQTVIAHRFALHLTGGAGPLTLEQIGRIVGVTKERVRQIQNKALQKIRRTLEAAYLDRPGRGCRDE